MTDKKSIPQFRMKFSKAYHHGVSISEIARRFNTSRNIINKWVKRCEPSGSDALSDKSRKPKHSPNKTYESIQQKILEFRVKTVLGENDYQKHLE